MAGKKSKNEIEALKSDIKELAEAVWALRDKVNRDSAVTAAVSTTETPIDTDGTLADLRQTAEASDAAGAVSAHGYYTLNRGERTIRWVLDAAPVQPLAADDIPGIATTLAAVAHPQRLAILDAILQAPTSASELVESLGLGTTGAAYHHLNVLQSAGFVTQMHRGVFRFRTEMIPVYLTVTGALGKRLRSETVSEADTAAD